MGNIHRRKRPDEVRRQLIDATARIGMERGMSEVTVDAICRAADVTKGAFFHYFASKDDFVLAVFDDLIRRLESAIAEAIATDDDPYGRFTRAYIGAVSAEGTAGSDPLWAALAFSAISDPRLRQAWSDWLRRQFSAHGENDGDPELKTARYAADGFWLSRLFGAPEDPEYIERLKAMTRGPER